VGLSRWVAGSVMPGESGLESRGQMSGVSGLGLWRSAIKLFSLRD